MNEFGPYRLDIANQCLWRRRDAGGDERVSLTPSAFALLNYLLERAGRLVTHAELLEALWPKTYVQPEVLKSHILELRKALGDRPKQPLYIETLPRRGYRFIGGVDQHPSAPAARPTRSAEDRFVGRDAALRALHDALRGALKGRRQLVFVTGEAGIGKTALVEELRRQAAAEVPHLRIARGQCVEGYGGKEAYYPVLEAMGSLCRTLGHA